MSYVAVGQTIDPRKLRELTMTAPAMPRLTCMVGKPRGGVTAWDTTSQGAPADPRWDSLHVPAVFPDRALVPCGKPRCTTTDSAAIPNHAWEWSDAEYLAVKGLDSMARLMSQRVRTLLMRLALPQYGFASGVDAYAYDASFCQPVQAMAGLRASCIRALGLLDRYYPPERWGNVKGAVPVKCGDSDAVMFSQWRTSKGEATDRALRERGSISPCLKAIMAAPSYCSAENWNINQRIVPVSAALTVEGDTLVPTPWLDSLLTCFTPTWRMRVHPSMAMLRMP